MDSGGFSGTESEPIGGEVKVRYAARKMSRVVEKQPGEGEQRTDVGSEVEGWCRCEKRCSDPSIQSSPNLPVNSVGVR